MGDLDWFAQIDDFLKKQQRCELFFQNPLVGITITDPNGVALEVNESQARITGIARSFWIGKSFYQLEADGTVCGSGTVRVLQTGKSETVVQRLSNGRVFFVRSYPVHDQNEKIRYVLSYLIDISDVQRLQKELGEVRRENQRIASQLQLMNCAVSLEQRMVYNSHRMRELMHLVGLIADSDTSVLITGPSGVGKEMIAREIHTRSRRCDQPFIKISCETIPETLLESELFGYEPGAFTGAERKGKRGLFEEGNLGTIFLDEIGEVPLGLQIKLLQVLQEHSIRRVGGVRKHALDIRIIAATNADLPTMIQERRFREDLYYRLNVIPIIVPTLDERRDDIPILVHHFLEISNRKYQRNRSLSMQAITYLTQLHYEGNVRQLRNIIERVVLLSPNEVICVEDIDDVYLMCGDRIDNPEKPPTAAETLPRSLKKQIEEREREILLDFWNKTHNTYRMAEQLEVSQPTISRKLAYYDIRKTE